MNAGELCETIQDRSDNPDAAMEVTLDGNTFDIDYIEFDDNGVIRIHLKS